MHRIDDPTASPTLPAPRAPGTPGYFTGGSPGSGGFAATIVRYEFMNAVQEELSAIAEAAGLTLDKTNNGQVLAALRQMLRFKLSQDEHFYISPSGSDSNDGLTPGTAFATGQKAWDAAISIDLNNHNLFLQFADGTYTNQLVISGQPLGVGAESGIIIQGNMAQPQNVIFAPPNATAVVVGDNAIVSVQGITMLGGGAPVGAWPSGNGLYCDTGWVGISNVHFGAATYAHMVVESDGTIYNDGNPYSITGSALYHMAASGGGIIGTLGAAVTITGNPTFSNAFAMAVTHGHIACGGCAYSGAATGKRYNVATLGLIDSGGAGVAFLPGSIAGTADLATFGLYI